MAKGTQFRKSVGLKLTLRVLKFFIQASEGRDYFSPTNRRGTFFTIQNILLALRNKYHCEKHCFGIPSSQTTFSRQDHY